MAANERADRILARSGPDGVLVEVSLIKSDYVKHRYLDRLIERATLDAATTKRVIAQAGREIRSDYELPSLLKDVAGRGLPDEAARLSFAEACKSIESDYEARHALQALLASGGVTAPVLAATIGVARSIDSDYELARVLVRVAEHHRLDATLQAAYRQAAESMRALRAGPRACGACAERGAAVARLVL